MALLEKERIHNSDKVLRIHRAREDSGQNEAKRLNACIGDALCEEEASSGRSTSRFMVCLWMRLVNSLTNSELETQRKANMEKNACAVGSRFKVQGSRFIYFTLFTLN